MSRKLYCVAIKDGSRYVYEEYFSNRKDAKDYAELHRHAFIREGYWNQKTFYFHTMHCLEWKNDTWVTNY